MLGKTRAEGRMEQRGGLGRGSVLSLEHRNGKSEKPAARLGCVGGKGWGLAMNVFTTHRLLCVHAM